MSDINVCLYTYSTNDISENTLLGNEENGEFLFYEYKGYKYNGYISVIQDQ